MKQFLIGAIFCVASSAFGQSAVVDVTLSPAGSFKLKSEQVTGYAQQMGDKVEAHNILVDLRNVTTGISLRDKHTKEHLEVKKFPQAVLVVAKGRDGKGMALIKIRNIKRKVAGTYTVSDGKLTATFPIMLSDFKITGIKYMGVGVDNQVNVTITVPVRAGTQARSTASVKHGS